MESAEAVEGLVKRSRTSLGAGPGVMFKRALDEGGGEVTLEITGEQYARINT
jgi:hypothetical protein